MSIASLLNELIKVDGISESGLEGVSFFKSYSSISRTPLVYNPGIVIVGQGRKVGYLEDRIFEYDSENYLVLSVPLPFECETFADNNEPLLGVYISIDMPVLHELIAGMKNSSASYGKDEAVRGLYSVTLGDDMRDAVVRLLRCLKDDKERDLLGRGIVREIMFRALCGEHGETLFALAHQQSSVARVSKSMDKIHSDYKDRITVEDLAVEANMSVSAFHRAFKEVTSDSPLQYLKKIRLDKAKTMMISEGMKASVAAISVGYESVSQFSREFKRQFGVTPTEAVSS